MIVKDLLMQCSAEEIVSELMKLCRVDEEEKDSVRQSYMKLLSTIKRAVPVNTKIFVDWYFALNRAGRESSCPAW
mgnify:CR=1 FL=1